MEMDGLLHGATSKPRSTRPTSGVQMKMGSKSAMVAAAAIAVVALAAAQAPAIPSHEDFKYLPASRESYLKFGVETEKMLNQDVLDVWFPRSIDNQHGGFYAVFSRDWKPGPTQGKFSVFQGRMTWISSQMVVRRPETKDRFLPIAQHGLQFLNDVLWDKKDGGYFWGLDDR